MILTKFHIIWPSGFRGKAVLESTNKKQELPVAAIFVHRGPPIDASYQVSVHLAKRFQRRRFLKIGQSETRIVCGGMFVNGSGRNEQSQQRAFYSCLLPSFRSFGKTVSEEKNLKNQRIRNKNRLWWPCLLTDRN